MIKFWNLNKEKIKEKIEFYFVKILIQLEAFLIKNS